MKNKVLIVDDETIICEVGKEIFELMDIEALTAESLDEAIQCFRMYQNEISLVILDYHLNESNGIEVRDELKKINNDFIAVLASGSYLVENKKQFTDKGFNEIISKPYGYDVLKKLLTDYNIIAN